MDPNKRHDDRQDYLARHLHLIDERIEKVRWISKDPIWLKEGEHTRKTLCDLLIAFEDGKGLPIEVKASHKHRSHAKQQIRSGRVLLEDEGYQCEYGIIAYYTDEPDIWGYEKYDFDN